MKYCTCEREIKIVKIQKKIVQIKKHKLKHSKMGLLFAQKIFLKIQNENNDNNSSYGVSSSTCALSFHI